MTSTPSNTERDELNFEELCDALDGLKAYDSGSTDSGIHDEALRRRCIDQLHAMSERKVYRYTTEVDVFLAKFIREYRLSDEALEMGYGPEDAFDFMKWLGDEMDFDL
jgi:hypothetical protein